MFAGNLGGFVKSKISQPKSFMRHSRQNSYESLDRLEQQSSTSYSSGAAAARRMGFNTGFNTRAVDKVCR